MSVRGKITKLFTALVTLAVVATLCVLLVACDPDGKKGEDSTGGGDAIFTEGVTLAELTEKINAAESFVWSCIDTYTDSTGVCIENCNTTYALDGETYYVTQDYEDDPTYYECSYSADGYDYDAYIHEDGPTSVYKSLSKYGATAELATELLETFKKEYVLDCLKEVDGKIVFNEKNTLVDSEDYVEGSGYVRLNGNCLEYGYREIEEYDGETTIYDRAMTLSLVNAYSFEITPELKEAEKTATWVDYVRYNGVTYRKAVDEATGEEYYYVSSNSDGATPETTINTLPVKPRQ